MFDYGLFSKDHPVWLVINNMEYIDATLKPYQETIGHDEILKEIAGRKPTKITKMQMVTKKIVQRRKTTKVICIKNDILFKFDSMRAAAEKLEVNPNTLTMAIKRNSKVNGWTIKKDV